MQFALYYPVDDTKLHLQALCTSLAGNAPADAQSMPCSDGSMQVREGLQLPDLRQNIIQLFFKHLTSPDEAIIATAQQGLAHVISNHKMPKGLLQLSLRPILVNLAYHNKLKLPLLKGLARLLQLLASWFNVTLGELFVS